MWRREHPFPRIVKTCNENRERIYNLSIRAGNFEFVQIVLRLGFVSDFRIINNYRLVTVIKVEKGKQLR